MGLGVGGVGECVCLVVATYRVLAGLELLGPGGTVSRVLNDSQSGLVWSVTSVAQVLHGKTVLTFILVLAVELPLLHFGVL